MRLICNFAIFLSVSAGVATAQLPISGRPVTHAADGTSITSFSTIDTKIQTFMQNNGIEAGVVGINRGGRTIYLRSFGWLEKPIIWDVFPEPIIIFPGIPLPETAMLRVASVTKVVTAAAIHAMAEDNLLGPAGLNRKVFNLAGNGGLLNVDPAGGLGDPDFANITISHLLGHAGGFRRADDPYNNIRQVAIDLGVPSPPTFYDIMRWRLGRPLADVPGAQWINNWGTWRVISTSSVANQSVITTALPNDFQTGQVVRISDHAGSVPDINGNHVITVLSPTSFTIPVNVTTAGSGGSFQNQIADPYSNFGMNVLGQIVETAPGGYDNYVRNRVLGAGNWIPNCDWARGRTFLADRNPREPRYQSTVEGEITSNIYPPHEPVPPPYGGFSIETGFWAGGIIASAQAMLTFGSLNQTGYTAPTSGVIHNIGSRITDTNPPLDGDHTGGFDGTCSILDRNTRGTATMIDDQVVFIAFTKVGSGGTAYERLALVEVNSVINNIPSNRWPNAECDGFWVNPGTFGTSGRGGYHDEYSSFSHAVGEVCDGSKLQLKAGSSPWTGTLSKRLVLKAPEGAFIIGQP